MLEYPTLDIYYDIKTKASDTYLKYLTEDCRNNGIQVRLCGNPDMWGTMTLREGAGDGVLVMKPTNAPDCILHDPDDVDKDSATATGIFNYITENYPERFKNIMVIGRGLVGKQLIDKLVNYGYTVIEVNSQTDRGEMLAMAYWASSIIVGLAESDKPIFNESFCKELRDKDKVLIDAANNFDTKDKLRCGKWTRQVIIDRVKENYNKRR